MANGQRSRRYFFRLSSKRRRWSWIRSSGRSIPDVCADLDLTVTTVRNWMRQARVEPGSRRGLTSDERASFAPATAESHVGGRSEIDQKAAAFFAKESDRPDEGVGFIEAEKASIPI